MTANNYPTVINGSPVDANSWFNPVAQDLTAVAAAQAAAGAKGYNNSTTDTTSAATTTTVEIVSSSFTINAINGVHYKVTAQAPCESTASGDQITARLRQKLGAVADTSGAEIRRGNFPVYAVNQTDGRLTFIGDFVAAGTGQLTIVLSILRAVGSGTVKANATASPIYWLVEVI